MKDKERKRAIEILAKLPKSRSATKLQEEFDHKGFLSKREMKVLNSLAANASEAASA